MQDRFIAVIDSSLARLGYSDRSKFIRDAIYEKLHSMGVPLDRMVTLAPDRAGKGGRPRILVAETNRFSSKNVPPKSPVARVKNTLVAAKVVEVAARRRRG